MCVSPVPGIVNAGMCVPPSPVSSTHMAARYSEASRPREIDLALARLGKCPVADCLRTPRARGKPYLTVRSIQPR
eukprot:3182259-Pyramimonas_sp.AAC.1